MEIPVGKLCDAGCGDLARCFSEHTGRYRCQENWNSCPGNRKKNSEGLKTAHKEGRLPSFTEAHRKQSQISHRRKLVQDRPFEKLGPVLRKRIVLEEQGYRCLHCENSEWMGFRITLEIDHIDGNRRNNKRKNLRGLCPNCHSITDTWKVGTKAGNKRKATDEQIVSAYEKHGTLNKTLTELDMNWGSVSVVKRVLFRYKLIDKI